MNATRFGGLTATAMLCLASGARAQAEPPVQAPSAPPTVPAGEGGELPVTAPEPAPPGPPAPNPTFVIGQWRTRIYGFVELDVVHDSTQAFPDLGGWPSTAIPRSYTYAGSRDNLTATIRNSRVGLLVQAPDLGGIRPTLTVEGDFMGNQPSGVTESAFLTSPAFRLRIASMQLDHEYASLLLGFGWELFGFQPFFVPATDFMNPVPGGVSKRDLQVQLTHTFRTHPIDIQLGVSANRPPQAASGTPDMQAAARLFVNGWTGIHTPGVEGQRIVGTSCDALAIAVSGSGRRFRVADFEPTPAGTSPDPRFSNALTGYAIAVDAYLPVIPKSSVADRGNALTLTGELTTGTGYADLLGNLVSNGGGPATPASNYPMIPGSPDPYVPNIQPGLVTYDNTGNLHTIDWRTFVVGAQYYLPFASGRVFVSGNYADARSVNVARWGNPGQLPFIFTQTRYWDANIFWDVAASMRLVLSYQDYRQTFADGGTAHNVRTEVSSYFWF